MKIGNSKNDQAASSSNTEIETEKAPTTFLNLPAEIRNIIYDLAGCLKSSQICEATEDNEPEHIGEAALPAYYEFLAPCLFCSFRTMFARASLSLWVNRNSSFTVTSYKDGGSKKQSLRHNSVTHVYPMVAATKHGEQVKNGVEQPALTKVSKQVRNDTLPIFYGSHSFMFTLFDRDIDTASIFKWLRTIGKDSAALLREVKILVRSKRDKKYAENELKPALKKQGLNTDGATHVKVVKLPYPFCYCEGCMRKALGEY